MRSLPLLLILFLCTCGPAQSCHAQSTDTLIVVPKLPYPKAKIWPPERNELSRPPSHHDPEGVKLPLSPGENTDEVSGGTRASPTAALPAHRLPGRSPSTSSQSERLIDCISLRHAHQLTIDLTTLQESKKGQWLKYLPTVRAGLAPSLNFSTDGTARSSLSPTLSIGLNSSLIYTAHRDKQQRAAAREAIIQQSKLKEATEIAKFRRLERRLQVEIDKLTLQDGIADIDRQLFLLYQKQYENHDISPEEYLLKRRAFLLQELRNQQQLDRIQQLQYQLEDLAGCHDSELLPDNSPANLKKFEKKFTATNRR